MERAKFADTPIFSCSRTRGLPGLPPLPAAHSEEPSELYQLVLRHCEHPPIMRDPSWTRAAPFKETQYARTPSESIANNYTPTARDLKMRSLAKVPVRPTRSQSVTEPTSPRKGRNHLRSKSDGKNGAKIELPPLPPSRAMTPMEQLDIIKVCEAEAVADVQDLSSRDLKRYEYYITEGIPEHALAPQESEVMERIVGKRIPEKLRTDSDLDHLASKLKDEVKGDYNFSLRKAIVDYILKDEDEKQRLHISAVPSPFPQRTIRAPVPWHHSYLSVKEFNSRNLFTTNQVMTEIQNLWCDRFSKVRFVDGKKLFASGLPVVPNEFESMVKKQCAKTREFLRKTWIPACAQVLVNRRNDWSYMVPNTENDSTTLIEQFFSCVASLMSIQLRGLVINSLADFVEFLQLYKDGNDFGETFSDMRYVMTEVLTVGLQIDGAKLIFDPPFRDIRDLIIRLLTEIVQSAENLPRVEIELFPEMRDRKLILRSVRVEETLVRDYMDQAVTVFKMNTIGPQK